MITFLYIYVKFYAENSATISKPLQNVKSCYPRVFTLSHMTHHRPLAYLLVYSFAYAEPSDYLTDCIVIVKLAGLSRRRALTYTLTCTPPKQCFSVHNKYDMT